MQIRTTFLAAAASAVVLAAAGIGFADTGGGADDTPSPAPTATSAPAPGPDALADGLSERRLVAAGPAGSVQYRFTDVLAIASVDPAPGWTAEIEQPRGAESEVVFTHGARRIDVEVEIEDGAPSERVRERWADDRAPNTEEGMSADDGVGQDVYEDHGDDGAERDVYDAHSDDRVRSDDDDDRSGRRGGHDDDDRSGRHGGHYDDDRSGRERPEDD